jgi:hypothetical protein
VVSRSEKRTTARAFHDAVGVEDWRILFSGAHAYSHAGSFDEAATFAGAVADVAQSVGHFPSTPPNSRSLDAGADSSRVVPSHHAQLLVAGLISRNHR